ncbi:MAG: glycogen debranching protein GlgX [Calditrichaeota bacterium]|nr:glycogen debranching protein GlgX [Calditrichota bacterium]
MKNIIDRITRNKVLSVINPRFEIDRGSPFPFGATLMHRGINFALFSPHAKSVSLVLFQDCTKDLLIEFPLDPKFNRTGHVWHAFITGLDHGIKYGFRIVGEEKYNPVDERIVLLDPYARITCGGQKWGHPVKVERDGKKHTFRVSAIVDNTFNWGNDAPLNVPLKDTIIYELHLRGYTVHHSSGVKAKGTFLGLTEKIPYLKELGVTAVELMPITDFDETGIDRVNPRNGEQLLNFWGYDPISFFAPKSAYAFNNKEDKVIIEFKRMVKKFHEAGIEVILDMVFNHTGEGGEGGPIFHFKGLDKTIYYLTDPKTGEYLNFSGCGNTLNCNHPVVRDMILDSLRYWVMEMHVDGFRFDLASILGRGRNGEVLSNPPLIERIADDPILANTKLIAEAWDAAGLYQVGDFPHFQRWMEWNGKFRDDIRRYVRGDKGMVPKLATRLSGSADLYEDDGREPYHSVNFVTCHDGFTLEDLVSYNEKHNWENGENNRDGSDVNFSWNCGVEGESSDPLISKLRARQKRNLLTILLLSQGVPMLLAGDEFGRTQKGNNNAYCQDNDISWINWRLVDENNDLLRFVKLLIAFRKKHSSLRRTRFKVETIDGKPEMSWHGLKVGQPDWSENSRCLGLLYAANPKTGDPDMYLMFNAENVQNRFDLPPASANRRWHVFIDTFKEPPEDIFEEERTPPVNNQTLYTVGAYSTAVLISR